MTAFLLVLAAVMFAGVILNRITSKLGVPILLAFILLGMLFGEEGIGKISFDNFTVAEELCSVALIFIMFYGGFGTNWKVARPVVKQSVLLSTAGVVLTAGFTGLFCRLVLGMGWLESFLTGSVIGSTDAASVFYVLRSKRLNLKYNTASLLEVESGSNDPCAYMLTALFISLINGNTGSGWEIVYMLFAQIFYGAALGVFIALLAVLVMKKFNFTAAGFDAIFVFAVAVFAYAAPAAIGGNGYLSTYIVGIILGNSAIRNKKSLVPFFDGITGIMQMLLFFLLGLLSYPSKLIGVALPSLAIAVFLTFVARPLAVTGLLLPFKSRFNQIATVSWAGVRGAASIVFAIMAHIAVNGIIETDIFHIIFCIVLFSILLQGSLLGTVSGRLKMIDDNFDVMKTFSDYSDEVPVRFIQFRISEGHKWQDTAVKNIILPPETILVLIIRGEQKIIPNGRTVIKCGDLIVLSAVTSENVEGIKLSERLIKKGDEDIGKTLSEMNCEENALVIMIKREGKIVIPKGNTVLKENDIMVINRTEQ